MKQGLIWGTLFFFNVTLQSQNVNIEVKDIFLGHCFNIPNAGIVLDEKDFPHITLPIFGGRKETIKLSNLRKHLSHGFHDLGVISSMCTPKDKETFRKIKEIEQFYLVRLPLPKKPSLIYCFAHKNFLNVTYDFELNGKPANLNLKARYECGMDRLFAQIPSTGYTESAKFVMIEFDFDGKSAAEEIKRQLAK